MKLKSKYTFAIVCSFIVNKLRATDSSISPGLINAFRELFHQFQIVFDRKRLTFSVAIRTIKINKCNQIQPKTWAIVFVNI